jgi:hypothetical protein
MLGVVLIGDIPYQKGQQQKNVSPSSPVEKQSPFNTSHCFQLDTYTKNVTIGGL